MDVYDEMQFQSKFPAEQTSQAGTDPLIAAAATPASEDRDPEASAFQDWWAKDSTKENFQGLMGVLGAIGGGLAGLPLGGTDTSSLERAAVRAHEAPGQARRQMQQRRFVDYIDEQLESETNAGRRDMLEAARANPQQAAQYLAMESPESKQKRLESIAELEHEYKMEEIGLQNEGKLAASGSRGGITAGRQDLIDSANAWYRGLPSDTREEADAGDMISLLFDPSAIKFMPYLYSPHGGMLYRGPESINMDLSGDMTVTDEEGRSVVVEKIAAFQQYVADNWDNMSEEARRFYDLILMRYRASGDSDEMSEEARNTARELGLE
jgi:hypothetical protein